MTELLTGECSSLNLLECLRLLTSENVSNESDREEVIASFRVLSLSKCGELSWSISSFCGEKNMTYVITCTEKFKSQRNT